MRQHHALVVELAHVSSRQGKHGGAGVGSSGVIVEFSGPGQQRLAVVRVARHLGDNAVGLVVAATGHADSGHIQHQVGIAACSARAQRGSLFHSFRGFLQVAAPDLHHPLRDGHHQLSFRAGLQGAFVLF